MNCRFALCVLAGFAVLIAGCDPQRPAGSPAGGTAASPTGSTTPEPAPVEQPESLDAGLRHEGYSYYGFERKEPAAFKMTRDGQAQGVGSERFEPGPKEGDAVRFEIVRDGSLGQIGNQIVELRKDGIYTVSLGGNMLDKPMLELPADLPKGKRWSSNGAFALGDGRKASMKMTYEVRGPETIETPMGRKEALKIVANGTMTFDGKTQQTSGSTWLVKGLGMVKTEMRLTAGGKTQVQKLEMTGA